MSVSSIDSSSMVGLLSQYYYQNRTSNSNTASGNSTSTVDSLEGVTSTNSDGDTFQMSGLSAPTQLSAAEMYSEMDTDGDGSVSESEFAVLRPSDVTAEMAANLYSSFDTDSSGSLTESEFETAMNNALSVNTVSATSSARSTAAASGGGTASASNSCPLGNSSCTGCGQCGKTTASSSTSTSTSTSNSIFSSTQNNTNAQTSKTSDYFAAIATKAYETNSVYL